MEDTLQSIFGYLDTDSLKQSRLVCSSWNPTATSFLMKRTYFELQSIPISNAEEYVNSSTSLTSVKINEDVLSQLSRMKVPVSFSNLWKSIFVSCIPSASGIKKLTTFLSLISSGQCPNVTHLKIKFEEDPEQNPEIQSFNTTSKEFKAVHLIPIRSIQLSFDDCTNTLQVSAFLQQFLRKEVVPNLKVLVVEFPGPKQNMETDDENPHFSKAYKTLMETFEEFSEVLRSLRVFKVKSNVPCGVSACWSPFVEYFLYHTRMQYLPGPGLNLHFTAELKELEMGSGIVRKENEDDDSLFFPCVLNPSVASVLRSLDLSGVYILEGFGLQFPSVKFPHMPCLRKLTVELVGFKWIKNFNSILEKAPAIRDFRIKNTWIHNKSRPFLEVKNLMNFLEWEETWEPGGYQSLNRLELGDSIDVKDSATLQRINRIFPNVKQLQFTCDDKSQRLRTQMQSHKACCCMNVMALRGIVEGLKGWTSLEQLTVTYWPLHTVTELLDHFHDCAAEIPNLRLYDFKGINDGYPTCMAEIFAGDYLIQMKEKLLKMKVSPNLLFVLHNSYFFHQNRMDGNIKRLHGDSVIKQIFRLAENEGIFNFRSGT